MTTRTGLAVMFLLASVAVGTAADPTGSVAVVQRASAAYQKRDWKLAIRELDEAIRLDPVNAEAWRLRACAHSQRRDADKAIPDLTQALRLNPGFKLAYSLRGFFRLQKREWDLAIDDATMALMLDPHNEAAFYIRGDALVGKGDYDKGIADLSESIRLDPKYAPCFYARALAWGRKSELTKCTQDLEQVLKLDPGHRDAAAALAAIRAWKEQAAGTAVRYMAAGREDMQGIWRQGMLLQGADRYGGIPSVSALAVAHTPLPETPQPQPEALTREEQAQQAAWLAVSLAETPDAIYRKGLEYAKKGDWAAAFRVFDRVLRKDENHAPALIYRAWLRASCPDAKFRDAAAALADAKRACELTGWANPGYFEVIAAAYAEAGMFENAAEWQRAALRDADYARTHGGPARERLRLYEQKQPARAK